MTLWLAIRPHLSAAVRYLHISYLEAKSDYYGTRIGVLWIPLSTLIFAALLAFVFHTSGPRSQADFFLYVLSGYVCWNLISDSISGSTDIIQKRLDFAVHNNLTLAGLFGKILADRLFEFGLNLILLVAMLVIVSPGSIGTQFGLMIPLAGMLVVASLSVSYLVNLLTIYFPDLAGVVRTAVRVMFFATPVFWSADGQRGLRLTLERYNPAAYYLRMFRQVAGLERLDASTWLVGAATTGALCVAGLVAFRWSATFVRNLK